jgi:endonuclease/exonuclease/phosphatase family metal-dependent hydrolase
MKIIVLNIWGGTLDNDLLDFFKKYSDTDIFLLQEVFDNATDKTSWDDTDMREAFKDISVLLPSHQGYFAPAESGEWGLASFVKKDIDLQEIGDIFVHGQKNTLIGRDATTLGRNMQYLKINNGHQKMTLINFHGLWSEQGKTDTQHRLDQSKRIIDFLKTISDEIILCGDFNVRPDTESLKMIERELNLRNLISEYEITSTRTSHYKKSDKFADYILISQNVLPKEFKVLPDEVSDHAALFLEM